MGDGDGSALGSASSRQASELRAKIGAGFGGGMGGFDQRAVQGWTAASGTPVTAFAAAFVVPGTQTCPGRQRRGAREPVHVTANLAQDDLREACPHPRDSVQSFDCFARGAGRTVTSRLAAEGLGI